MSSQTCLEEKVPGRTSFLTLLPFSSPRTVVVEAWASAGGLAVFCGAGVHCTGCACLSIPSGAGVASTAVGLPT